MKKMITLMFTLLLATAFASTQAAPASQDGEMMKKKGKSEKAAPPTSDADIQKCISDKFAKSKNIENGAAKVAGGEATLTGSAKNGGAKGGANSSARACGARKIVNNITVIETVKTDDNAGDKKKSEKK